MREEMAAHEGVVAARIARPDAGELVQVERRRAAEVHAVEPVEPHELAIERDGRPPRRQAEHDGWMPADGVREVAGQRARQRGRGTEHANPHHPVSPASL